MPASIPRLQPHEHAADRETVAGCSHPTKQPERGDPMADYVALWMSLDDYHQDRQLTEEGWSFLSDRLQRPIEMRLLERRPRTLAGAAAALGMAAHLMDHLEGDDAAGDAAWYRRLRLHLLRSARDFIHGRCDELALEPRTARSIRINDDTATATCDRHVRTPKPWEQTTP